MSIVFHPPLEKGTLQRRYKRFLADIVLEDGRQITAHCANTGRMEGLTQPESTVWVSHSAHAHRRYAYTWEMLQEPHGTFIGANTQTPNALLRHVLLAPPLQEGTISSASSLHIKTLLKHLPSHMRWRPEGTFGASRLDFLGRREDGSLGALLEAKNVHWRINVVLSPKAKESLHMAPTGHAAPWACVRDEGLPHDTWPVAFFPDSVTLRGTRHLQTLSQGARMGLESTMVYVVQREDCCALAVAHTVDPQYYAAFLEACACGVKFCAVTCVLSPEGIQLGRCIPVIAPALL